MKDGGSVDLLQEVEENGNRTYLNGTQRVIMPSLLAMHRHPPHILAKATIVSSLLSKERLSLLL